MPKPICVSCQRFYRPEKNGFSFIEAMPIGQGPVPPGTTASELWKPYKLWQADLWKCHGCGHQLIVGAGYNPISVHHEPDFTKQCEDHNATLQVNDC